MLLLLSGIVVPAVYAFGFFVADDKSGSRILQTEPENLINHRVAPVTDP